MQYEILNPFSSYLDHIFFTDAGRFACSFRCHSQCSLYNCKRRSFLFSVVPAGVAVLGSLSFTTPSTSILSSPDTSMRPLCTLAVYGCLLSLWYTCSLSSMFWQMYLLERRSVPGLSWMISMVSVWLYPPHLVSCGSSSASLSAFARKHRSYQLCWFLAWVFVPWGFLGEAPVSTCV